MRYELREMDFGAILDQGIKLFKVNFVPLVTIVALFFGPFLLVGNYASVTLEKIMGKTNFFDQLTNLMKGNFDNLESGPAIEDILNDPTGAYTLIMVFGLSAMLFLLTPLTYLCVYRILSDYMLGLETDLKENIRWAISRFKTLISAFVISWFSVSMVMVVFTSTLCLLGSASLPVAQIALLVYILILIIAMLLFSAFAAILPCVVAMEDVNTIRAVTRTYILLKGSWWKTFGIYFLISLIVSIIVFTFSSIGQMLAKLLPGMLADVGVAVISTLFTIIFQPITWAVVFLIYLDLRIRKENFDLDILAQRAIGEAVMKPDSPSPEK